MRRNTENGGVLLIFLLLGTAILVMLLLILVPEIRQSDRETREELDLDHENTAEGSARVKASTDGAFHAAYDYYNKRFVVGAEAKNIEPYGESDEHKGMIIFIEADGNGEITLTWGEPREVTDVNIG